MSTEPDGKLVPTYDVENPRDGIEVLLLDEPVDCYAGDVASAGAAVNRILDRRQQLLRAAVGRPTLTHELDFAAGSPILIDNAGRCRIRDNRVDSARLGDIESFEDLLAGIVGLDQPGHIDQVACVRHTRNQISPNNQSAELQITNPARS